ncbi:MAG: hypothetical protein JXP73_21850 [Deltaproteobacteria bacterium]|nr:hypothetical protein [Deltaproteobacteria bacterium]
MRTLFAFPSALVTKPLFIAVASLVSWLAISAAHAEIVQVPEGGRPVPVGQDRVVCGNSPEGWQLSSDHRSIRPPASASVPHRSFEVSVAADAAGCARPQGTLTLVATGRWPEIDPASVTFYPDEGRLELKGSRLEGMQVAWQAGNNTGRETCLAPVTAGKAQHCVLPLQRDLPSAAELRWLPAHAVDAADAVFFDQRGQRANAAKFVIRPARFVLGRVFEPAETLDISQGLGTVSLAHPEAIATVDCGLARCEFGEGRITVRYVPAVASQVYVSARLAPRFFAKHGDKLETSASARFALLRCPLSVASGPPLRDAEAPHILVKMDERCRTSARLRWTVGAEPAEVVREVHSGEGDFVLLRTGQIAGGSVTITASRADILAGVIGSVTSPTMAPPRPQSFLELPKHGPINFIPTNREAQWSVAGVANASLVPLGLPGAYSVRTEKDRTFLRGARNGAGFVNLRYAYRRDDLPQGFEDVDLAVLTETITRPLHEASVPVSFTDAKRQPGPLAEFLCADPGGKATPLVVGQTAQIPFVARGTCRVVIHQERLSPEDGQQEVVLEIAVTSASGRRRSEASVNERMVLRPGGHSRVFYLKGITRQFDQVTVRLSHVVDESRYVLGSAGKQVPPSAQWTATVEGGRARLYVSLSVPAGLYRINEPAASLTLNFGVLGRITWLDRRGKEGLLGLETGVLGASLIPQQYEGSPAFPPTLVTLLGLGLRVEVGQGAAIGVHLWGAYEFRSEYSYTPSGAEAARSATHWSLLFGPSISIGNVGTDL